MERFTSRKFITAVVAAVVAVLADVGVIDPTLQGNIIAHATPLVYIIVEGVLDFVGRK